MCCCIVGVAALLPLFYTHTRTLPSNVCALPPTRNKQSSTPAPSPSTNTKQLCSHLRLWCHMQSQVLGDSSNRFSLSLGSSGKASAPQTFAVGGRGVTDLAASPCGTRLAVACADGALRLLEVTTGSVVGGFQAYYGSLLCCSFSPDGRCVCLLVSASLTNCRHTQNNPARVSRVAFGGNARLCVTRPQTLQCFAHVVWLVCGVAASGTGSHARCIARIASVPCCSSIHGAMDARVAHPPAASTLRVVCGYLHSKPETCFDKATALCKRV
jgi:hypothetical protein